jgi:hypothetical protein
LRKRLLVVGIAVVALVGGSWLFDARNGLALDESEGGLTVGMDKVQQGADVYFLGPTPTNRSGRALELLAVAPDRTPAGLEFVDARVYAKAEFPGGSPLSWASGRGDGGNLARLESAPIAGRRIAAHADLDGLIYLHFRVTSAQRPLTSSGVRFSYHRGLRDHSQVLGGEYSVGPLSTW